MAITTAAHSIATWRSAPGPGAFRRQASCSLLECPLGDIAAQPDDGGDKKQRRHRRQGERDGDRPAALSTRLLLRAHLRLVGGLAHDSMPQTGGNGEMPSARSISRNRNTPNR